MSHDKILLAPTRVTGRLQFGKILEATRMSAGMTRQGLATRLKLAVSTMGTRETGARNIHVEDAVEALGVCGYALVVVPLDVAEQLLRTDGENTAR
jgi:transcriptional regulator with XRE-family HTH domain